MMRLHVLSDIHLEFAPFVPPRVDADVIVLAGDIGVGPKAISWAKEAFPGTPVIYVLGNHEHYGHGVPKNIEAFKDMARGSNIHVLENDSFVLGDVVFFGCTLWTDLMLFGDPKIAGHHATQNINDYRKIRVSPEYRKLRWTDTVGFHRLSRNWIVEQSGKNREAKMVVVTHHAPSKASVPERYRDDLLSAAFASYLDAVVEKSGACLWIHGHVHERKDYMIGNTRVLCNSRGYPDDYNTNFSPDLAVEV